MQAPAEDPRMLLVPVPRVHPLVLAVCGLVNFVLPGVGLMVAACVGGDPARFMNEFWMGLTMLMLAFLVIGVIWSWIDGAAMLVAACARPRRARGDREAGAAEGGYADARAGGPPPGEAQVKQRQRVAAFEGKGRRI